MIAKLPSIKPMTSEQDATATMTNGRKSTGLRLRKRSSPIISEKAMAAPNRARMSIHVKWRGEMLVMTEEQPKRFLDPSWPDLKNNLKGKFDAGSRCVRGGASA